MANSIVMQSAVMHSKDGHLEPAVHQPLLKELSKHPPHALHEGRIQRLIVVLKVDPSANALDSLLPLL